jgi:hypothetical protein
MVKLFTWKASKPPVGVEEWDKLSPELRKKYIEVWVNLTVLAQYADKQGLNKKAEVKQRISYAAKKVKANALIAARLAEIQVSTINCSITSVCTRLNSKRTLWNITFNASL